MADTRVSNQDAILNVDIPSSDIGNENEPLLPQPTSPQSIYKPARWQAKSRRSIIAVVIVVIILLSFGGKLTVVPTTRIYEFILCHYHYDKIEGEGHIGFDDDLPEELCKGAAIQDRLNVLMTGLWVLCVIPALFTTIAYGSLADRIGRRPIFALAMAGIVVASLSNILIMAAWKVVPLEMVWVTPIFLFIGGGEAVANMMFYAMANDIVPEEQRSTIFLLGSAGAVFADMLAPSLSSFLMLKSPWIPVLGGIAIITIGTALIFTIPETLYLGAANPDLRTPDSPSVDDDDILKNGNGNIWASIHAKLKSLWESFHEFTKILQSPATVFLLLTFMIGPFGRVGGDMFLRYVSNRYHWTLREAGFLLSLQGFINLVLIVLVLPSVSYLLVTYAGFSNKAKDLLLAEFSAIVLTFGALIVAIATNVKIGITGLTIWTLGTGYPPFARSLVTTQVDPQHVGRLFAAIAMIEIICYLAAVPLEAALYHIALQRRGLWEGLPYFALAVVCGIATVCVSIFGYLKRRELKEELDERAHEELR